MFGIHGYSLEFDSAAAEAMFAAAAAGVTDQPHYSLTSHLDSLAVVHFSLVCDCSDVVEVALGLVRRGKEKKRPLGDSKLEFCTLFSNG